VLNLFDKKYEIRDGSDIGVGAPHWAPMFLPPFIGKNAEESFDAQCIRSARNCWKSALTKYCLTERRAAIAPNRGTVPKFIALFVASAEATSANNPTRNSH